MRATYADLNGLTVNLFLDAADTVRPGLPIGSDEVLAFLAGGGSIGPYEPPPPPPTLDQMDTASLNDALTAPGTFTRALGEILFGVIKGTIPVTPALTKPQFVAMLKAKMR
jgi:hypothetical protein